MSVNLQERNNEYTIYKFNITSQRVAKPFESRK